MRYLRKIIDDNYIEYANYVVKDRAIPYIEDGLKPVQRRVLHSMYEIEDGRYNKVANIVGHTMKYHPHGDKSIGDALINIANKEYFIDKQGNFGNIFTGDNAAAPRYIEARLTELAKEVLFNKKITKFVDSYDGRNLEPVFFPAKIPILLLTGVEGIAVGMSTKILPHNFNEILKAQIDYLEGKEFELFPDFLQGGTIDVSGYNNGHGKVKVRAIIETVKDKKVIIREIPYNTTTESIIASIEKAAKRGKLKISSVNDYTTDAVEIEVNLARGYNANDAVDALYAFTDCEISISPSLLCIKNELPVLLTVSDVLKENTDQLVSNLKRELEIELDELKEKWHMKSLAQIFIENRIYKEIEELISNSVIIKTVIAAFDPYKEQLNRAVTNDDVEKLLTLQIRRISRFDINKNRKELDQIVKDIKGVEKNLGRIIPFTIDYINYLLNKFGEKYPRKSKLMELEDISVTEAAIENLKLGYDRGNGFIGTAVKSEETIKVSEFSRIFILFRDGTYKIIRPEEKTFIDKSIVYFNKIYESDDRVYTIIYRNKKSKLCFVKRFSKIKYILDKEYRYFPEDCKFEYFTVRRDLHFQCFLERLPRMRTFQTEFNLEDYSVKGISASGNRITTKNIIKMKVTKNEAVIETETSPVGESVGNQDKPDRIIPEEPELFKEDK